MPQAYGKVMLWISKVAHVFVSLGSLVPLDIHRHKAVVRKSAFALPDQQQDVSVMTLGFWRAWA